MKRSPRVAEKSCAQKVVTVTCLKKWCTKNSISVANKAATSFFRDFTTTGDGIISALQVLRIMHKTGQPLGKLKTCLQKYPQAQRNLPVERKAPAG